MALELKRICKSALNLKIISFFHEHPATVDTAHGIAAWLNHNREEIKEALNFLVRHKILISERTDSTIAYAYTQDKQVIREIDRFLQNK